MFPLAVIQPQGYSTSEPANMSTLKRTRAATDDGSETEQLFKRSIKVAKQQKPDGEGDLSKVSVRCFATAVAALISRSSPDGGLFMHLTA